MNARGKHVSIANQPALHHSLKEAVGEQPFPVSTAQVSRSDDSPSTLLQGLQGSERLRGLAYRLMWAMVALKLVFVAVAFPLYQAQYRGANYATVAQQILERTRGHALYTSDVSASGLAVTAHLDIARLPQPALTFPPAEWHEGFVIAYAPDLKLGVVAAQYRLGGNALYLLCRGKACAAR